MSDIKKYGTGEGVGFFWIKQEAQMGAGHCRLVAIDEVGNITRTPVGRELDDAAPTVAEAVEDHIGPAINQADQALERRRRNLAENPPEDQAEAMDPATERFMLDPWY
jgi:hypothetical protein